MPRGSVFNTPASGGSDETEMLELQGNAERTGRYTISKTYYVDKESDLLVVPPPPPKMQAVGITYRRLGGGVYEKTVIYEGSLLARAGVNLRGSK